MSTSTEVLNTAILNKNFDQKTQRTWGWVLAAGLASTLLGTLAILGPLFFGLAATIFLSATLLISGGVLIANAIKHRAQPGFGISMFSGILALICGLILWRNPLAGLITMSTLVVISFFFSGIFRMVMSIELKPAKGWGWLFFGGLVTAALASVLLTQLPVTGLWLIGTLIGIDLIFLGFGQISTAMEVRTFEKSRL